MKRVGANYGTPFEDSDSRIFVADLGNWYKTYREVGSPSREYCSPVKIVIEII